MRTTRAELLQHLNIAAQFANRQIVLVSSQVATLERLRRQKGFIPVEHYPTYHHPLIGEIGCDALHRFLLRTKVKSLVKF